MSYQITLLFPSWPSFFSSSLHIYPLFLTKTLIPNLLKTFSGYGCENSILNQLLQMLLQIIGCHNRPNSFISILAVLVLLTNKN